MSVLSVKNLCKSYPFFTLQNISFTINKGEIMGFIGRNGAGKTTTLKSLLNIVHPNSGEIAFFDLPFIEHEFQIKQQIGFVCGGIDYYGKKKLSVITDATRRFYPNWDEAAYQAYMQKFELSDQKTPSSLSAGMKVKYALTLALSHQANLLILDEPTSGLDPISRDELLDIFLDLADKGISILFSTHITSDLEKCADTITYIKKGHLVDSAPLSKFTSEYALLTWQGESDFSPSQKEKLIGFKRTKTGFSALIYKKDAALFSLPAKEADLESIMVHYEKEDEK